MARMPNAGIGPKCASLQSALLLDERYNFRAPESGQLSKPAEPHSSVTRKGRATNEPPFVSERAYLVSSALSGSARVTQIACAPCVHASSAAIGVRVGGLSRA